MPLNEPPYEGYVYDRNDPKGLMRVRVVLPGLDEDDQPTGWLLPRNAALGPGKGNASVPHKGAEVSVEFVNGNPEQGRYTWAHWGEGEVPSDAVVSDDGDNQVYDDGVLRVERDERSSSKGIRVKHSDGTILLEYDANTRRMRLALPTSLDLKVDGELKIEAPTITINERVVMPKGDPI